MTKNHKAILEKANRAISEGNYEGFLSYCTEETVWTFVGDKILQGKEAVRQWMATTYTEPPQFVVENLIEEGDFLTAIGKISAKDEAGRMADHLYCDVWRFREGRMDELTAFVIKINT